MYWKPFPAMRGELIDRYVRAWHNPEAFARFDAFRADVMAYVGTLTGSHPVVKAMALRYILENAPLVVCPDDPFGLALEAQKMDPILDIGCHYNKILNSLNAKWQAELGETLNRPEDAAFVKTARNYLLNEFYIDYNHSTPCWDDLFALGYSGILKRAKEYRASFGEAITKEQSDVFDGVELAYEAVLAFLLRLAGAYPDGHPTKNALLHLHDAPPADTYEAMLMGWLVWYVQENIDCQRVRTMGGLDQLYRPFVERDLAEGRYTRDEMRDLFAYFMLEFHSFRVAYQQPMYLGGVDEKGNCIVNDLSYLALEAYNLAEVPNPKLQAKIGANTPDAFLDAVLETIRRGNSSISVMNDDNAAASLVKLGVPLSEARTNLMSGCWDFTVKDHEVKTIPVRVSLPKLLEYELTDGVCLTTGARVLEAKNRRYDSFDEFLAGYLEVFDEVFEKVRSIIGNWEKYLEFISPSNLYTGTMTDALAQGVDGYARGMKYNTTIYTIAGLATLVDSLCAIRRFVFEEKRITLEGMLDALKADWAGYEDLRAAILADGEKYGNGSDRADELMVSLCKTFALRVNGVPNGRETAYGRGFWKLGTLSIDKNVRFGVLMKATPDGRRAGEPISKNMSGVYGMEKKGVTAFLGSLSKIDFTDFPHAGMADAVLHPSAVAGEDGLAAFRGLVRAYFGRGGHSIQFNIFSAEMLRDAQAHPEKYRNLQIRVCGWNVYFVELEKVLQDAFIKECETNEAAD